MQEVPFQRFQSPMAMLTAKEFPAQQIYNVLVQNIDDHQAPTDVCLGRDGYVYVISMRKS